MDDNLQYNIERYLSGAMPPDEVVDFEKLVAENPEVKKELNLFKEINQHLSGERDDYDIPNSVYTNELRSFLRSEEAKDIQKTIAEIGEEQTVASKRKGRSNMLMVAASVVIFLFASLGYWFLGNPSTDSLYVDYYSQEDLPSIVKRGDDSSSLEKGALAFQDGNHEEAVAYFESYKEAGGDLDPSVFLYLGVAYSKIENIEKSIENFDAIITSNSLDASKGLWFKALAYLKAGQSENAKTILEEIVSNPSHFNSNKAKELLGKLD